MSWWTWRDLRGALVERIHGHVLDVSASGCRVESDCSIAVGSIGLLEVCGLDKPVSRVARVRHTFERPGAAVRFVLHLEFLSLPATREL
jgi:hypothetical protein